MWKGPRVSSLLSLPHFFFFFFKKTKTTTTTGHRQTLVNLGSRFGKLYPRSQQSHLLLFLSFQMFFTKHMWSNIDLTKSQRRGLRVIRWFFNQIDKTYVLLMIFPEFLLLSNSQPDLSPNENCSSTFTLPATVEYYLPNVKPSKPIAITCNVTRTHLGYSKSTPSINIYSLNLHNNRILQIINLTAEAHSQGESSLQEVWPWWFLAVARLIRASALITMYSESR